MSAQARQVRPADGLRRSVDAFWLHGLGDAPATLSHTVTVLPDGCVDLIFHAVRTDRAVTHARLFVAGVSETAYPVPLRAGESFVGVRFRPGMSRVVLDADPAALLGRAVDAADVDSRWRVLEARMADTASPDAALALLQATVAPMAVANLRRAAPDRTRRAIALLGMPGADARVAAVAETVGLSIRSLRRDVVAWTGLSPGRLSRILRFQAALELIRAAPDRALTPIAFEAGYADHPHMCRELRAFAQLAPSDVKGGSA